jgi:hypothetical protein
MVVRIWRTEIDVTRAEEYRDFAHSRSLPMSRAQPGFVGCSSQRRAQSGPGSPSAMTEPLRRRSIVP